MTEDKEKKTAYELVNVPTQHVAGIQTPEGEVINLEMGVVEILNKLSAIEKKL